jgi:hypothetical protein
LFSAGATPALGAPSAIIVSSVRFKRSLPVVIGVLLVAAAVVAVVQLRRRAPPEPARLLPGADGFFYVNLKWLRTLKAIGQLPPVPHDPEYERFLQETGFQFERDLDEAAFAVHYPAAWGEGATGGSAPEMRFSEVMVGRFDGQRLIAYLRKLSAQIENYHSSDIYIIPLEGRTLRIAILSVDTVAGSNQEDPNVIRGLIDRSRKLASPFGGPALLRQYYKSLPVVSKSLPVLKLAWFIGRVDPSKMPNLGTWSLLLQKRAALVVSAYYAVYSPTLHLRAEAFSGNSDEAQTLTDKVATFLTLFHVAEDAVAGKKTDPDVRAFFDSLRVERQGDRAILTAAVPPGFLRKVMGAPLQEGSEQRIFSGTEHEPASSTPPPQPTGKATK